MVNMIDQRIVRLMMFVYSLAYHTETEGDDQADHVQTLAAVLLRRLLRRNR